MTIATFLPRKRNLNQQCCGWPVMGNVQTEMNRMFDDFFTGFSPEVWNRAGSRTAVFTPKIDVVDSAEELLVTVELPGLDEKDIDISITQDYLSIQGEKRLEQESNREGKGHYYERSYGAFERVLPLTAEVEQDKVEAHFKKGVLTLKLPKAQVVKDDVRKISVKSN